MDTIVIPQQDAELGDIIEYQDKYYKAEQHFSQGKDMKEIGCTHIMYSNKGAFWMVECLN